jgi:hypothetical protein
MSRQSSGHTLQMAALVHEAYPRIINQTAKRFQNNTLFRWQISFYDRQNSHFMTDKFHFMPEPTSRREA